MTKTRETEQLDMLKVCKWTMTGPRAKKRKRAKRQVPDVVGMVKAEIEGQTQQTLI